MSNQDPIYNIGAVSRMTGIPAATLRIWERRYDFPQSARTEGGHRLYSQHQIDRLRWVKLRTDTGMQIRQAVLALRTQEEENEKQANQDVSLTPIQAEDNAPASDVPASYIGVLKERLQEALLSHDLESADKHFDEAMALYRPEDLLAKVIQPILFEIGLSWSQGEVNIATEHLASHYLRQRMIVWLHNGPEPFDVPPIILACAPEEYHQGSLLITGVLLRRRRWPVIYLGQSLPLEEVAKFATDKNAAAVVFVAMMEDAALALTDLSTYFPTAGTDVMPFISYGGRIFNLRPELREKVPGMFLGETIEMGVDRLDALLQKHLLIS